MERRRVLQYSIYSKNTLVANRTFVVVVVDFVNNLLALYHRYYKLYARCYYIVPSLSVLLIALLLAKRSRWIEDSNFHDRAMRHRHIDTHN